jgi:hypothetical protein
VTANGFENNRFTNYPERKIFKTKEYELDGLGQHETFEVESEGIQNLTNVDSGSGLLNSKRSSPDDNVYTITESKEIRKSTEGAKQITTPQILSGSDISVGLTEEKDEMLQRTTNQNQITDDTNQKFPSQPERNFVPVTSTSPKQVGISHASRLLPLSLHFTLLLLILRNGK